MTLPLVSSDLKPGASSVPGLAEEVTYEPISRS